MSNFSKYIYFNSILVQGCIFFRERGHRGGEKNENMVGWGKNIENERIAKTAMRLIL